MKDKEKSTEELAQALPPASESAEGEHDARQPQPDSLEQLYEQARRHAEQLETLSVIESALSETTTEAEMLDVFVLAVRDPTHLAAWLLYAHTETEAAAPDGASTSDGSIPDAPTVDALSTGALTTHIVASWRDGMIQVDDPLLNRPIPPDLLPLARLWTEDPGEIFYAVDVQRAPEVDADLREWTVAQGMRTLMVLPMLSGGRLQGVIVLQWSEPYPLSATEQFVLRRLLRPTVALLARRRAYLSEEAARAENARRAAQLQTAAEVARAASSIIDLNELLPQAVELVRERFGLYYIGIFLVDETDAWVALRAGSGEAGRIMLENKHGFPIDGSSMIGRCVAEARPQLPERVETAVRYVNPLLPDTTAEIALPLVSRNQMIGAMSIQSSTIRTFSAADITILQTVADQLANAIQNARLFEQLNTSLTESEMQTEVSMAINEAQSIEEITRAAAQIGEFIGMEGISLWYFTHWDTDGTPLIQDVYGVVAHNGDSELRQQKNVPVNQEILAWFFSDAQRARRAQTSGAISVFNDLSTETEIPDQLYQNLLRQGYGSIMMAPLNARNRLLGFLTFFSENPMGNLPARYIQVFVRTLIDEVATGLDRYLLLRESERRARRMETALEVSRYAASILDEEALLTEVAELIRERFDFYYVGIFMVDDSGQWAALYTGTGEAGRAMMAQAHRLRVGGDSMIGQCVSSAAPRISLDVGKETHRFANPLLPDTRSELALPLISRNVVIGAISIQSAEVAAYSKEDITILQTMADQLATAVENARLFDEASRERGLLQALLDNSPDYIFFKDRESRFIRTNQAHARYLLGISDPREVEGKTDFDLYPGEEENAQRFYDEEQELMETGEPVVGREWTVPSQSTGEEVWVSEHKIPIQGETGEVVGLVGIGRDITSLKVAEMVLEQRALQLQTAAEVSRAASSILDPDDLIQQVVGLIQERFNLYYTGLFLVDQAGEWAVLRAGTGEAGQQMLAREYKLRVGGESMIGWCIVNKQARIALDVGEDAVRFENSFLPETRSELALPLVSRGEATGALTIQSTEEAAFSDEDVAVLQTMADQVANAIENARLFAESQASLEELQRLQQSYALDMWEGYVAKQDVFGYAYDLDEVSPVSGDTSTAPAEFWGGQLITRSGGDGGEGALLVAPFDVRSEPVGFLSFEDPQAPREWTDDNVAVVEAVREQLSLALENRLLIDQSQNALREARAREREVRFLQEVAAFLNATENIVAAQTELRDRLQAFIPVDSVSIVGYDTNRVLRFLGEPAGDAVDIEAWRDIDLRDETGYALVAERGAPLIQEDTRINPRFWEDGRLVSVGMLSRAILPLQLGTRILGTLNLESRETGAFSRSELMPVLQQIAAQVASAIERANLLQRAQESAGESRTLYEATSALAEATSYETVLRAIVGHTIVSEFAWAEIVMFTPDPETGEENSLLEIVSSWSSSPAVKMMEVGLRIPAAEFPALQLLSPGEQLFICEDMTAAIDMDPDIRTLYLRQGVRAIVIARLSTVGIATGGEIGLLRIRFSEPYHPSEQDVRLYHSIADQAAVVLSNQKLLRLSEARTEQLTAAVDFANLATGLAEREDLLRQSVDFFKQRFGFYYVSLFMLDEDGEWAVLQSGTGDMGDKLLRMGQRVRVDVTSMIGWSILNDRPRIAQDVTRDSLYFDNPLLPDVRAAIALPLKSRGQINGALSIESNQRFVFTTELVSTLELMATQLANMLESSELYDRSQNSLAETRMLYRIAQQITDAATVEDVFKVAVEGVSQRPEPDWIVAGQLEPRQNPTHLRIVWSWSRDGAPIPFDAYPLADIPRLATLLRDDESFVTPDVTQDPLVDDYFHTIFGQLGLRAMAAFQLRIYGVQYGTIMVHSRKAREFSTTELRFYENVSRQTFVALQNIGLVEETRAQAERRDILNEVLRTASSSLDRFSLMRDVGRVLSVRLERPVLMWNWDGSMLTPVSVHEAGGKLVVDSDEAPSLSRLDAPVLFQVIERMTPVSVDFAGERGTFVQHAQAYLSEPLIDGYIVPLRVRGTVFGVMLMGRQAQHPVFNEELRDFVRTAGVNVSVALQTAVLYQEAQETAVKLQEVDKLKNQFMANMSHELRTPLNSIIGFSRVILKGIDGPLTDMQKTDLTAIYDSGRNLLELINDILDISKIGAGKMEMVFEPTDLQEIARGVITTMAGQLADRPVKLLLDLPDKLPVVLADARRIRQVLTNLVGNAVKFTDEGFIKVSASYDKYQVTMSVEDTGIGIPADRRHAVFEQFEQVDSSSTRRYGGTGLGLPLSREFVRLHGGDMEFESVVGEGSCFYFWIPINGPGAKREEEEKPLEPGGQIILAVDDDEGVITLFQRYLEKQGYKVAGMTTGEGVVETAKRLKPYAITLDVIMPGKDGWQIIRELKSDPETRDIPIIVCSIMSEADKGLSMGVADYLVKPVTEQDLMDALLRLEHPGAAGHVLVVDDNPDDRKLLRRILEDAGYKVQEAPGGAEAISFIHTDPPSLVVLDLMMPDVDGFAVLENLKMNPLTRDIPVVVVTAKELGKSERERLQQRVQALLQKGLFDQNQLLGDVLSALERLQHTQPQPEIA